MADWVPRVLDEVDAGTPRMVALLGELVAIPSLGGSDAEQEIQARLAEELATEGLEVDHWPLPLPRLLAAPDFPGMEVERAQAWGVVGRLAGTWAGSPSLMFNAHADVVPPGNLATWTQPNPYSGSSSKLCV